MKEQKHGFSRLALYMGFCALEHLIVFTYSVHVPEKFEKIDHKNYENVSVACMFLFVIILYFVHKHSLTTFNGQYFAAYGNIMYNAL